MANTPRIIPNWELHQLLFKTAQLPYAFPAIKRMARVTCKDGQAWHTNGNGIHHKLPHYPNAMFAKMA